MGIDVVDLFGLGLRILQGQRHRSADIQSIFLGNHHMIGLARGGITRHLGIDTGFPSGGMLERFQY